MTKKLTLFYTKMEEKEKKLFWRLYSILTHVWLTKKKRRGIKKEGEGKE